MVELCSAARALGLPELPELCSAASAAKNAPSMAWITILTASLVYIDHTCCKYGKSCSTCCKFGSAIPVALTWRIFGSAVPEHQSNCPLKQGSAVEVYWYMLGHERMWGGKEAV